MKIIERNGKQYRLPNTQNEFQREMYIHLINRKWGNITEEPGYYRNNPYDAILPEEYIDKSPVIYEPIRNMFKKHLADQPFRIHKFFNHIVSSQAANANLFLPIIKSHKVNQVLRGIKADFGSIASDQLCRGYRIEYWDEEFNSLNDHSAIAGTDSDIAIAYYNSAEPPELCLWLIEHKLTEKEFTTCGGSKSNGKTERHNCNKSMEEIIKDRDTCYYHSAKGFNYWNIMEEHYSVFPNHADYDKCPFKGGMNQLWRNILLAISVEKDDRIPFKHVYFSVVRHPDNIYLNRTIDRFRKLIDNIPMFSVFTSKDVLKAVDKAQNKGDNRDAVLDEWKAWYEDFYRIK